MPANLEYTNAGGRFNGESSRNYGKKRPRGDEKRIVGTDHQAELIKLIRSVGHVRNIHRVFNDFLEMAAIAISNCVDVSHRDERERRYMELINAYDEKNRPLFREILFHLTEALDERARITGPEDVLGPV